MSNFHYSITLYSRYCNRKDNIFGESASCLVLMRYSTKRVAKSRSVEEICKTVRTGFRYIGLRLPIHLKMSDRVLSGKEKDSSRCLYDCFWELQRKNTKRLFPNWTYADNLLGKRHGAYLLSPKQKSVMNRVIMWLPVQLVLPILLHHRVTTLDMMGWLYLKFTECIFCPKATQMQAEAKQRQAEQEALPSRRKEAAQKQQAAIRARGRPSSAGCCQDAAKLKLIGMPLLLPRCQPPRIPMQSSMLIRLWQVPSGCRKEMARSNGNDPKHQLKKKFCNGYVDCKEHICS